MWEQQFGEMNEFQGEQFEYPGEMAGEMYGEFQGEGPLTEMQEMELASELLTVTNEAELDQFLGGLMKKAGGFMKGPAGKALGGILKGVAKKALPIVGGAIGSFVAPGVGTAIGSSLGSAAGKLFGLELEGLSNEDREFEVARRYVRLASAATRHAASAPRNLPPHQIARRAVAIGEGIARCQGGGELGGTHRADRRSLARDRRYSDRQRLDRDCRASGFSAAAALAATRRPTSSTASRRRPA